MTESLTNDELVQALLENRPLPEPPKVDRAHRRPQTLDDIQWPHKHTYAPQIQRLLRQPRLEQRSPEWFFARDKAITASDTAAALGLNPYQGCNQLITTKVKGKPEKDFQGNANTNRGVIFEDVALYLYEKISGVHTLDFGLLSHHSLFADDGEEFEKKHHPDHPLYHYSYLKGSPDGLGLPADGSEPLVVEIKCPQAHNFKPGQVHQYYYPQLQINMWLMGVKRAHFIQYMPRTDWLVKERIDIVEVAFNEAWWNKAHETLRTVWQTIVLLREGDLVFEKVTGKRELIDLLDPCVARIEKQKKSDTSDDHDDRRHQFIA